MQRAFAEIVAARDRRRRARLLDRPLRALLQRRVARPRAVPGSGAWRRSAAHRWCWAERPGCSVAAVAIALAGRAPEIGSDTAVAVVVSALFGLGALLALSASSPPGLQAASVRRHPRRVRPRPLRSPRRWPVVTAVALRLLHRQLLLVGFDRGSARALGGRPAAGRRGAAACCSRSPCWSACRASARCWW